MPHKLKFRIVKKTGPTSLYLLAFLKCNCKPSCVLYSLRSLGCIYTSGRKNDFICSLMQTITCPRERGRRAHTVTVYHSSSRPRLHSNWEPLLLGDPWGPPPRAPIPPCADSGRVNRADAFWQIHSEQRWCILSLLSFFTNPNSLPLKSHLYFTE